METEYNLCVYDNEYQCTDCNLEWELIACDSQHNDRCPECDKEIMPIDKEF